MESQIPLGYLNPVARYVALFSLDGRAANPADSLVDLGLHAAPGHLGSHRLWGTVLRAPDVGTSPSRAVAAVAHRSVPTAV